MRLFTNVTMACLLIGVPAVAQSETPVDCPQTVSVKDYFAQGGKLEAAGSHNHIYNCNPEPNPDCQGQLTGSGLIDTQGNVHNLQVVTDDFPSQYRQRLEAEWLDTTSQYHYVRPALNGTPVCIAMRYEMRIKRTSW